MKAAHALVIGGSKGLGRAIVQIMSQAGYVVSVISRKRPQDKFKNIDYWTADITKKNSLPNVLNRIVRQNGKLNHLIFCQQFRDRGDDWQGQIKTSLTASKEMIELVVNDFENVKEKNTIVFVSSIAAFLVAKEQPVAYHVAKAGLEQMIRYYACALGPKGIRVNGVSPNRFIKEENKNFYYQHKEFYNLCKKISPLGKMVTSEEVANVVAFLCSSKSSGITGQSMVIDAGVSLQEHTGLAYTLMSLDHIKITQRHNKREKNVS